MSRWDIRPAGVQGVLAGVQGVAEGFDDHLRTLNTAMEGAGAQASSGIIGQALMGFADSQRGKIEFVFARTGAAMSGAANATQAYVRGDTEMAANAQASATSAPDPRTMPGGRR
ncbi:DUF6507 family protein [Kibdelosporangium phytohabitans]|uniref:ESX-1 secretion-associated protein n=1 Tax=Kibdelosporangium phytohabitans TaxID=860235 RepID=A0A0N9HX49_9PSEU|nr:DUF6507 family protein [Kibdelosporangium phytohabitans]ALG06470.1 hypothetical protein AOZ06_05590 [Kibdelosporangium phytohabitans]MBE1467638.1 nitrogen fixation/metabolism regulation signal transduction histidine kinase [Kibdelosporangium phytohabitans]